ncbi:hypothetical protein DF188_08060 [Aliarcobacter skirrowii]|uniref:Uncharacterized protein n=1 Tax=Aliarcobacter skirrowii TaxID=28200 RepID=A0A2U2BZC1_9BACT|nr:hypothetical protein [Aliarcobacter skirrowii]PWE20414.1 hypothetical protein DF188_08060 [Aliarcobacter skirrowii]
MTSLNIQGIDGKTGIVNISDEELKSLEKINEEVLTSDKIKSYIDNMNILPELKVFLFGLIDATFKIGNAIYNIGKKIVEIIIFLCNKFPNTARGILIGFIIGSLITMIPLIGWLLGGFILPATTAIGGIFGAINDLKDDGVKQNINNYLSEMFGSLKNIKVNGK